MGDKEETVSIVAMLVDKFSSPMSSFRAGLGLLKQDFKELNEFISPLTKGVAGLAAGFLTLQGLLESRRAAEEQIDANQRLRIELEGNADAYEKVTKKAEDMGRKTTTSADQIKKLAATLSSLGVSANDLERVSQIAIDTAAKFGGDAESRAQDIALLYGGILPRGLSRSVLELRNLSEAELLAGKGLDVLEKATRGYAERIGQTNLSRSRIEANLLEDAYAGIGEKVIDLQVKVLPRLRTALEALNTALDTKAGKIFLDFLGDVIEVLARGIPYFVGILALTKAITLSMSAWARLGPIIIRFFTYFLPLFTVLTAFVGVVVALGVALGVVVAWATGGIEKFSDLGKIITDTMDRINDGTLTWRGFLRSTLDTLVVIGYGFKQYLYDVPIAILQKLLVDSVMILEKLGIGRVFGRQPIELPIKTQSIGEIFTGANDRVDQFRTNLAKSRQELAAKEYIEGQAKAEDEVTEDHEKAVRDRMANDRRLRDEALEREISAEDEFNRVRARKTDDLRTADSERELAAVEELYKEKLISLDVYLERTQALQTQSLEEQLKGLDAAQTKLQGRIQAIATENLAALREGRVGDMQDQSKDIDRLTQIERKRQEVLIKIDGVYTSIRSKTYDILKAEEELNRQFAANIDVRLAKSEAHSQAERRAAEYLELQYKQLEEIRKLEEERANDPDLGSKLQELRAAHQAEIADFNRESQFQSAQDLVTKQTEAQRVLSDAIIDANQQIEDGTLNIFEAQGKINDAQQDYTTAVQGSADAMKELVANASDPEALAKLQSFQAQMSKANRAALNSVITLRQQIRVGLEEPTTNFFQDLIEGAKSAKEAFADFLRSIASELAHFVAQAASRSLLNAIIGTPTNTAAGGSQGWIGALINGFASAFGGGATTANSGRIVPGSTSGPNVDSTLMYLTAGEGVTQRPTMEYYGASGFNAWNQRLIPRDVVQRYASGTPVTGFALNSGGVTPPFMPQRPQIIEAVVAPTPEHLERLLTNGDSAFLDYVDTHRDKIRSRLGI